MAKEAILKNEEGTILYPRTISELVFYEKDKSLKDITDGIEATIGDIQGNIKELWKKHATGSKTFTVSGGNLHYLGTEVKDVKITWSVKVNGSKAEMKTFKLQRKDNSGSWADLEGVSYDTGSHTVGNIKKEDVTKQTVSFQMVYTTEEGFDQNFGSGTTSGSISFVAPIYSGIIKEGEEVTENVVLNGTKLKASTIKQQSFTVNIPTGDNQRWWVAYPEEYGVCTVKNTTVNQTTEFDKADMTIDGVDMYIYSAKTAVNGSNFTIQFN